MLEEDDKVGQTEDLLLLHELELEFELEKSMLLLLLITREGLADIIFTRKPFPSVPS